MKNCLLPMPVLLLLACNCGPGEKGTHTLYVGTYTTGASEGIYALEFDTASGSLSDQRLVAKLPNPSYLAFSGDGQKLYAIQETDDFDAHGGGVTAFGLKEGKWSPLGSQGTAGAHPCHLSLSGEGHLAVANYSGGNVAIFGLEPDGSLSGPPQVLDHKVLDSTKTSHAHMARFTPDGLFVADLGLDAIKRYGLVQGQFRPGPQPSLPLAAGAGPRHFEFGGGGAFLYVINELNSTLAVFARDGQGRYAQIQVESTLDPDYGGKNACADLHLSPDGRFLYASNRGENTIAIFSVDPRSGRITALGREPVRGDWPRNFVLDPSGGYLLVANQRSGNITVFKRDRAQGGLEHVGGLALPDPSCLVFGPVSP